VDGHKFSDFVLWNICYSTELILTVIYFENENFTEIHKNMNICIQQMRPRKVDGSVTLHLC